MLEAMEGGLPRPPLPHPHAQYNSPVLSHMRDMMLDKFWGLLSPPGSENGNHESDMAEKNMHHSGKRHLYIYIKFTLREFVFKL